jgi:hypothetical protein
LSVCRWSDKLIIGAFPLENFEIENKDGVHHRHLQLGYHGRDQQAADLRITQRLPQRPPVQCERQERQYGGKYRDQDRAQPQDAGINQCQLKVVSCDMPFLNEVEKNNGIR